ncbi:hypothetical protein ABPG72_012507 [Tetrahymena utriculariae]
MINQDENESVVVSFGTTGCGKSTLLNYLLGKELLIRYENLKIRLFCDDQDSFRIGHTVRSQTKSILIKWNGQLKLADFPGLYDTGGLRDRLDNFKQFIQFFNSNKKIKLLLIEEFSTLFTDRGSNFSNNLDRLNSIFGGLSNIQNSSIIIFNKYNGGQVNRQFLSELQQHINSLLFDNNQYKDILNHLFQERRIFLFEEPNRSEIGQFLSFDLRYEIINQIHNLQGLQINHEFQLFQSLDAKSQTEIYNERDSLDQNIQIAKINITNLLLEIFLNTNNYWGLSYFQNSKNIYFNKNSLSQVVAFVFQSKDMSQLTQQINDQIKQLKKINYIIQQQEYPNPQEYLQFRQQFHNLTFIYANRLQNNTFLIVGNIIMSKTVQNYIQQYNQSDFVVVAKKFILDSDIYHYGKSIYIQSNRFTCLGKRKISVEGSKGRQNIKIDDTIQDGLPGLPGENGGTVILVLNEDVHFESQQSELVIDVSGGEGGDGQNGKNGQDGQDGEHASISDILNKKQEFLAERTKITSKTKEFLTFNSVFEEFYFVKGQHGQKGKDGGKGGHGGIQGNHGFAYIIINQVQKDENNLNQKIKIQKIQKNAQHGAGGKPGKGGKRGNHIIGVYKKEFMFPTFRRIKNVNNYNQYDHKSATRGNQVASVGSISIGVAGTTMRVLGLAASTSLHFISGIAALAITGAQLVGSTISASANSNWVHDQKPEYIDSQECAESGQQINDQKNENDIQQPEQIKQISIEQITQQIQDIITQQNFQQNNSIYKFDQIF